MNIPKCLCLFLLHCAFFSCKKNYIEPEVINATQTTTKAATATYPLDWETLDFMPTPPGTPIIPVPWGSGASGQFTKEMANDYHKADGWVLVYNTFNTTTTHDNWYFMLYNVYRGLLRLYYYIPSNANFINSDNIVHALLTEGAYATNSPVLNFAAKDVVRADTNYTSTSMVEPWRIARSTWYMFQYELAYDQNMSSQNFSTFSFKWPVHSTAISKININGKDSGTLTGLISVPGTNITASSTVNISSSKGNNTIMVNGPSDVDKMNKGLGSTIVNAIKSGITSGAQGIVKNLLSGIFKKTTNPPDQSVNLKLQSYLTLEGTMRNGFLVTSLTFAIPGYNQSNTPTWIPAYEQPLGVFYISNKPNIIKTSTIERRRYPDGTPYFNTIYALSIAPNSYQLIFNPAVTSIATIQNIKADIVSLNPDADYTGGTIYGNKETIAGYTYAYGNVTGGKGLDDVINFGTLAVRITFEVVPKDGATPVVITKSFLAKVN